MKFIGFNNKVYNIDMKKYLVKPNDSKKRSKYHLLARELLSDFYKGYYIYEELKLPGSRNPAKKSVLFLDFFIPSVSLGVEVHGSQHYEFNAFFHKSLAGWRDHKYRDSEKEEWCALNNINLIVFNYADSVENWRKQLECQ